jgi:queuosine precursor transporter
MKLVWFALLNAAVVGANWALETYGVVDVGFGLQAPAGVFFAGAAFALRDLLHEEGGRAWVFAAIICGAVLSWWLGDAVSIPGGHTSIAVASGCAFLLAELADLAVYTPLRERQWVAAAMLSNIAGAVIDSALFLWLAFGTLDHMNGQVVAKVYVTVPFLALLWWSRRERRDLPRYAVNA